MTVTTVPSTHPLARRSPLSQTHNADFHNSNGLQYERREAHKPRDAHEEEQHYILTLLTDSHHHGAMTALRKQWFPSQLLKVDAHVTLFHALPGSKLHEIQEDIAAIAARTSKFEVKVGKENVFEMGKGVGINISNHDNGQRKAASIHAELRNKWESFLSDQDKREKWRGHYTIMNKEDDKEMVGECLAYLKSGHAESRGTVEGLSLFLYDRGWWREGEVFKFT
ncbi:hypothetical protein NM208_g11971 [Fusarium decemcellulare]|uniref:Uncharacterized protein n=1 Tax=Fusarium decemcellulare TaxID=57161 RepID=A0ACC1RR65_9HYPO|nr:hypothetical protein NM208_g11971 [Fusarium decemcellulare]